MEDIPQSNTPEPVRSRWLDWLLVILALLYVGQSIWQLAAACHEEVHLDYWIIYRQLLDKPFPLNLALPMNSHCMFFPGLFWWLNLLLARGNEHVLAAVSYFFYLTIGWFVLRLVLREKNASGSRRSFLLATGLATLFWLGKWQLLISPGFALQAVFPVMALLAGCLILTASEENELSWPKIWGLGGCCLFATFSFGTGIALWPALGFGAWLKGAKKSQLTFLGIGMVLCLWLTQKFLPGFPGVENSEIKLVFAPFEILTYWLRLIGSPWASEQALLWGLQKVPPSTAYLFGGLGAATFFLGLGYLPRNQKSTKSAGGLGGLMLAVFAAIALALIAAGRARFFEWMTVCGLPDDTFSSRYLTWSSCFWLGLTWWMGGYLCEKWKPIGHWALASFALAWVWSTNAPLIARFQNERTGDYGTIACLLSNAPTLRLFPLLINPAEVLGLDKTLRERGISHYHQGWQNGLHLSLTDYFTTEASTSTAKMTFVDSYQIFGSDRRAINARGQIGDLASKWFVITDPNLIILGYGCITHPAVQGKDGPETPIELFTTSTVPVTDWKLWSIRGDKCREVKMIFTPSALKKR